MLRFTRPAIVGLALACALALPAGAQQTAALSSHSSALPERIGGIALRNPAVVSDDIVRLGDLFMGLSPQQAGTPIARAPKLGEKVPLDASWLARLASHYRVDWQPRSHLDGTVVERQAIVVGAEEVQAELAALFAEQLEGEQLEISIDENRLEIPLPLESEGRFGLEGLRWDERSGRFGVTLVYPEEGTPSTRVAISGRAFKLVEVPVLLRRLDGNDVIRREDIGWQMRRADRVVGKVITDPSRMVGQSPKRSLRAGEPVRPNDLRTPVLVERNALVTLRLRTGNMTLTAQGRALDEGGRGSLVRVINLKSNTMVQAVVADAGLVEVTGTASAAIN